MSLSYDKIKKRVEEGGFWTSYSDLATVLSILYLVLYVVATLRSTSAVVVERTGVREAQKEIESLKEQLRAYEVLKEDYVANQSKAEQKMYGELLSQMELLEDDASQEKKRLLDQAKQTAKKEQDLNRYQKIIKNIIATNQLAQKEIKSRDQVIRKKSEDIEQLQSSIQEKEANIRKNRQSIAQIQKSLQDSIHRLETAKATNARTRAEMKAKVARLQKESAARVQALQQENQSSEAELAQTRTVIAQRTQELEQTQGQLQAVESQKQQVLAELEKERESYQLSLNQVRAQHQNKLTEERLRFQESLQKEKLTAQEQLAREQAYKQKIEAEKARYAQQLVDIEGTLAKAKELAKQKEEALGQTIALRQKRHQEELEAQREGFTAQLESREKEFKGQLEGMKARNEALRRDKEKAAERYAEEEAGYQSAMAELTSEHGKSLAAAQARFEAGLAKEKLSGEARLARERGHLAQMEAEKAQYNAKLKGLSDRLSGTQAAAARQEAEYRGKLEAQRGQFERAMGDLKGMYEGNLAKERAAFEAGLAQERLSAAEREARQKAHAQKLAQEKEEYNAKMQGLADQLDGTRKAIAAQKGEYQRNIAKLSDTNQDMQRELAALRQRELDRTALAKKIKENFARSGIKADVNAKTGEVQIQFGEEYFDTGKAGLKDGMRHVLQNAMPAYAKSILEDDKLAQRIASVEIVGFASPTYKGAYVNPKDLRPEARKAVDYNMDLSYQRAKSIFDFAFNPKRFKYKYQSELLPMAKVTGQGYLRAEGAKDGKEMSGEEYCTKYDCTKSQKVVIKFHFKE